MTRHDRAVAAALESLTCGRKGPAPYAGVAQVQETSGTRVIVHGPILLDRLVADILQALEED